MKTGKLDERLIYEILCVVEEIPEGKLSDHRLLSHSHIQRYRSRTGTEGLQ